LLITSYNKTNESEITIVNSTIFKKGCGENVYLRSLLLPGMRGQTLHGGAQVRKEKKYILTGSLILCSIKKIMERFINYYFDFLYKVHDIAKIIISNLKINRMF